MERIGRHFDRVSREQILNSAILWTVGSLFLCRAGIFHRVSHFNKGDPFCPYAASSMGRPGLSAL